MRAFARGIRAQSPGVALTIGVTIAVVAIFAGIRQRVVADTHETIAQSYTTDVAQQSSITLADGSRVMLAPQSRLDVIEGFGTRTRTVRISGEAWLDVRTAVGAPFIVRAGSVDTRVLGTTFGVRHYDSVDPVEIMVRIGKVAARGAHGAEIALTAGTAAWVTDSTAKPLGPREQHAYTDWTDGKLVFDDAKVSVMLSAVSRWYGVLFTLTDSSLASRKVTVTFTIAERADMLAQIRALLEVDATIDGKMVTLAPRRAAPVRLQEHLMKPIREVGR
jgi:transmembrane sensor